MGDTQVTATVEENENKASYVIQIPDTVDFGKIQQPETEGNVYSTHDITVSCIQADNLAAGNAIAVLVKDASAVESSDPGERTGSEMSSDPLHDPCKQGIRIRQRLSDRCGRWNSA